MYRHVLFYSTRRYVLSWIWRKSVHTGTYQYVLTCAKSPKVRTGTYFCCLWRYMAVRCSTCRILSLSMAVNGGTWHYILLSITVYGSTLSVQGLDLRRGSPGRFSCAFESAALPTQSVATASSHCMSKLVYSCFSLACFGTPPRARLCHPRPASLPPPPRVQPLQQPRLPRAPEFPAAAAAAGSAV
jgi:hypothetical protein